jgi:hypothetical protein
VPLFIDRLPLHAWIPPGSLSELPVWSVSLPIVVSDPGRLAPPLRVRPQRWVIDTRFSGEAFAWRQHLQELGLDPDALRVGTVHLTPLGGTPQPFPMRDADLWLFSNIPALRDKPWRLQLHEGLALRDVPELPSPEINCPMLGMRGLVQRGLTVKLDLIGNTVSVWTPGPWHRTLTLPVRRALSGFSRLPPPWSSRSG